MLFKLYNGDKNIKIMQEIKIAQAVVASEIEGLIALNAAFEDDSSLSIAFVKALDLISATTGKIIFCGIGKSGHIAKNIASTMSSIGVSALFLHSAEAGHGDLGVIAEGDLVVLLSNSGEGQEIDLILHYCSKLATDVIGITSNPNSSLNSGSSVTLLVPKMPEAHAELPIPTVSSTIIMALGHSLVIAIAKRNQVSPAKYATYHPNGSIGMKFVQIREIMHVMDALPLVRFDADRVSTILMMTSKRMGCTGVVDNYGKLIGIITDGDLRRAFDQDFATAGDIMTQNPLCVIPDCLASTALQLMQKRMVQQLFVVDTNCVIGIVHWHDLLEYSSI